MQLIFGLFLCLLTLFAHADDALELKQMLEPLRTLEGSFEQKVKDKNGNLVQASEGRFAIKRPGYFLWESKDPNAQLVVGTPSELWVYDPDLEQATLRQKEPYGQFNPSELLSGNVTGLGEQFSISKQKNKGSVVFLLTPRSGSAQYKQVELQFKGKKPVAIAFSDQLNQRSEVRFDRLKVNGELSDALFKFSPPPGTDVLADE